jgi:hypothetical protein
MFWKPNGSTTRRMPGSRLPGQPHCRGSLGGNAREWTNLWHARPSSEPEVPLQLHLEPEVGGGPQGSRQAERHGCSNPGVTIENSRKMGSRYAQTTGCFTNSHLAKIVAQDLSRMCRVKNHEPPISDSPGSQPEPHPLLQKQTSFASCRSPSPTNDLAGFLSTDGAHFLRHPYLRVDQPRRGQSAVV